MLPTMGLFKQQNVAYADGVYNLSDMTISSSSNSLQDITISNTSIYISDNAQRKIWDYNIETNSAQTLTLSSSSSPSIMTYDYADNLVYTDSELDQICILGTDQTFDTFVYGDSQLRFSRIYDLAQTTNDDVYALISRHSDYYLIKKAKDQTVFSYFATMPALVDDCKLAINLTGDKILLLNNNQISKVENTGCTTLDEYTLPALTNISAISFDHKDDLYVLSPDGTMAHCTSTQYSCITINNASTILDFCLSPTNNTIYFVYPAKVATLQNPVYDTNKPFLNAVSSTPNINIATDTLSSPIATIETTKDTYIYTYNNLLSKTKSLTANQTLCVLEDEDSNFYYVLDTSSEYNIVGYVLKNCANLTTNTLSSTTYQTLYTNTAIYPFPTTLANSNSAQVRVLANLPKDAIITTTQSCVTPTDHNGASFVFVSTEIDGTTYKGYVDVRYLTQKSTDTAITPIFVSNATTKNDTKIYSDNECSNLFATLNKGTAVQIISTTNGISYIEWQEGDENHFGYAQYKNLDDGSISLSQTIGFLLMLVAIVACLVTISVINRNNQRQKMLYE